VFVVKNGDRFFLFNEKGELIIARLSPKGDEEISRWNMLEPTGVPGGREVVWSYPAFANRDLHTLAHRRHRRVAKATVTTHAKPYVGPDRPQPRHQVLQVGNRPASEVSDASDIPIWMGKGS
jgi:hypothetical protein